MINRFAGLLGVAAIIALLIGGCASDGDTAASITSAALTGDGRQLTLHFDGDDFSEVSKVKVEEYEDKVVVVVRIRSTIGDEPVAGVGRSLETTVTLKQPLGKRALTTLDGSTIPIDRSP
ncbi:hypothetical protein [Thermomonospora umbrina]|uniref:Uncharacterized protein n=1 Tax=Thermomonospora umbrina TaxID=111806 RepID=A0A3D9SWT6_9ACTN|nr:hypothetical protein [Thermomonospora umbrina]REF00299.1 hypothetical protein DFJ69_5830 [Thermomonospora umbrina]